jgi:hypothetical protein
VKFRSALLILAGILFIAGFISVGVVGNSQPRTFDFLHGQPAKKIEIQSESMGPGRDVRYYVIKEPYATLTKDASPELLQKGWHLQSTPGLYRRGRHGFVQFSTLSPSSDPLVTKGNKPPEYKNYVVVKVVDSRFRTAIKDRIANWASGKPIGA